MVFRRFSDFTAYLLIKKNIVKSNLRKMFLPRGLIKGVSIDIVINCVSLKHDAMMSLDQFHGRRLITAQ